MYSKKFTLVTAALDLAPTSLPPPANTVRMATILSSLLILLFTLKTTIEKVDIKTVQALKHNSVINVNYN